MSESNSAETGKSMVSLHLLRIGKMEWGIKGDQISKATLSQQLMMKMETQRPHSRLPPTRPSPNCNAISTLGSS
jgi:hypothetical protein